MSLLVWACDDHVPVDTTIHVGDVLMDDGTVRSYQSFKSHQGSRVAVAVIFTPVSPSHPALAVLLRSAACTFADTLGTALGTSCDVTAYDGYRNTTAMQHSGMSRELASPSFDSHHYLQSDFIPSVAELSLLYQSLPVVNPILAQLGGEEISTTPPNCWLWSSTEVEGNQENQAWLVSMSDGSSIRAPKTNRYLARRIVDYNQFNISSE